MRLYMQQTAVMACLEPAVELNWTSADVTLCNDIIFRTIQWFQV